MYTARQPATWAMSPENVRANRIPMSRPLMMVPTTRPRFHVVSELGTERDQDLGGDGTHSGYRHRPDEDGDGGGDGRHKEGSRGDEKDARNQSAPNQHVAQRDQQGQTDAVTDLGPTDDQGGRARPDIEAAGDRREQGLGVVEVGR